MKGNQQSAYQKNTAAICSQRVFNCGHSFHGWVGPMLKELAGAAGITGHEFAGTAGVGGGAAVCPYLDPTGWAPSKSRDSTAAWPPVVS
jgi:hypothetical protein